MTVLVSDTSVLIDLSRGGLIELAFSLPVDLAVPDWLHEREILPEFGKRLQDLGLRVEELSGDATAEAQRFLLEDRSLSLADTFALALAQDRGWTLLTGDKRLRGLAESLSVECHGVLWFLDLLEETGIAAPGVLHAGLTAIAAHPRCRLPARHVKARLSHYSRNL